ncbi:MAG: hypothetical protein WA130_00605 [Candidatus Methanoperedens sp.]
MGLIARMSIVVKVKVNTILNKFEDPRETLDYFYEKQFELLQNVKTECPEIG